MILGSLAACACLGVWWSGFRVYGFRVCGLGFQVAGFRDSGLWFSDFGVSSRMHSL